MITAIDPGTAESAYIEWNGEKVGRFGIVPNADLLKLIRGCQFDGELYIEMVACYGMPVGKETFETVVWIGRFMEAWAGVHMVPQSEAHLIYRRDVKIHHCGSMKAKDANVTQALKDKYGKPGTKKAPGRTYGITSHVWQAFAIATYVHEKNLLATQCAQKFGEVYEEVNKNS